LLSIISGSRIQQNLHGYMESSGLQYLLRFQ